VNGRVTETQTQLPYYTLDKKYIRLVSKRGTKTRTGDSDNNNNNKGFFLAWALFGIAIPSWVYSYYTILYRMSLVSHG
jgi:hypothetical protein